MIRYFSKNYWVFLMIVVLVSYGQLVRMFPWQDDHTLFFKLANIEGRAGYFGAGPFGEGVYKYIATPYIFVYEIFGLYPAAFFAFAISIYYLATYVVYKVFSETLGTKAGRVAGFLYAAGYVASDGYIRLFNSVSTSIGVILVSSLFLFYWRFFKSKNYFWYLLAIVFYFFALEFARLRAHYLIAVVLTFEVLHLTFGRRFKSIPYSLVRIAPFLYLFYQYFLRAPDSRSGRVGVFFENILSGEFHNLYSFLSAVTNIAFPDWLLSYLIRSSDIESLYIVTIFVFTTVFFVVLGGFLRKKLATFGFAVVSILWALVSRDIFSVPVLNISDLELFDIFLAGELLILVPFAIYKLNKKYRNLFVFLLIWLFLNIASYSVYDPSLSFVQYHRYLAHSFFALVGIFALLSMQSKFILRFVVIWGLINIFSAVSHQNKIVKTRSEPVKGFYSQLRSEVLVAEKGDVFYFDVADNSRSNYSDAFSVASMPEETALAWQYGIDRYDIRRVSSFEELQRVVKLGTITDITDSNVPVNNVHTFFYSDRGLTNTSSISAELLANGSTQKMVNFESEELEDELILRLGDSVNSIVPLLLTIGMRAKPFESSVLHFPYNAGLQGNSVARERSLRGLAFEYGEAKKRMLTVASAESVNAWQDNLASNAIDDDGSTFWRAHRVLWKDEGAVLTIDLKDSLVLGSFVWVNASPNDTPIEYTVETSVDGVDWMVAKKVNDKRRVEGGVATVVAFEPRSARKVRMRVDETLSGDSASVRDVWVVPSRFSKLDVALTEEFLSQPFGYIADDNTYAQTLVQMGYMGNARLSWKGDNFSSWQRVNDSQIRAFYDNKFHRYQVVLPAGGTTIEALRLSNFQIPGKVSVEEIFVKSLSLEEM